MFFSFFPFNLEDVATLPGPTAFFENEEQKNDWVFLSNASVVDAPVEIWLLGLVQ